MPWLRAIVAVLAALEGGWMVFDGARALIVGDYVTPRSGPYAGQLGPWAKVVEAVGIPPRSTFMKSAFIGYGILWLLALFFYFVGRPGSRIAMVAFAAGSLWYVGPATPLALVQLALLALPAARP